MSVPGVWKDLSAAGEAYGAIVVTWPDGTETILGPPLPNPADVTVPEGMEPGKAQITVHKGLIDGVPSGSIPQCEGAFEIAEDATVPVASTAVVAAMAAVGGTTVWARRRHAKPKPHHSAS